MASRLIYYGNVITRCRHLVEGKVIQEPVWLQACLAFPPLSEPLNPIIPDWESCEISRTKRRGPFFLEDGHRFDPFKPTDFPRDKQTFREDQPPVIYFTSDAERRAHHEAHPHEVLCLLPGLGQPRTGFQKSNGIPAVTKFENVFEKRFKNKREYLEEEFPIAQIKNQR